MHWSLFFSSHCFFLVCCLETLECTIYSATRTQTRVQWISLFSLNPSLSLPCSSLTSYATSLTFCLSPHPCVVIFVSLVTIPIYLLSNHLTPNMPLPCVDHSIHHAIDSISTPFLFVRKFEMGAKTQKTAFNEVTSKGVWHDMT